MKKMTDQCRPVLHFRGAQVDLQEVF